MVSSLTPRMNSMCASSARTWASTALHKRQQGREQGVVPTLEGWWLLRGVNSGLCQPFIHQPHACSSLSCVGSWGAWQLR